MQDFDRQEGIKLTRVPITRSDNRKNIVLNFWVPTNYYCRDARAFYRSRVNNKNYNFYVRPFISLRRLSKEYPSPHVNSYYEMAFIDFMRQLNLYCLTFVPRSKSNSLFYIFHLRSLFRVRHAKRILQTTTLSNSGIATIYVCIVLQCLLQ